MRSWGTVFCHLLLCFLPLAFLSSTSTASIEVDITQGNAGSLRVAVVPFYRSTDLGRKIGQRVTKTLRSDLTSTGVLNTSVAKHPYNFTVTPEGLPDSEAWRTLDKDILITGSMKEGKNNEVQVRLCVWDIATGRQLLDRLFGFPPTNWRYAAHSMSDHIYSRLTGEKGYFNTKITYIAEVAPGSRKVAVMDQDGENNIYLTDGNSFVSTPRFSPSANSVIYMTYVQFKGRIVVQNLSTGSTFMLRGVHGINSAPRFSPDGKSVLISESTGGVTNIYSFLLANNKATQLTNDGSINTSASYSPDGKFIVFSSDRSGSQQLYVMHNNGKNQRRISFGTGRYATPVWSPRGDWISFTKIGTDGTFYIGVMKPNGREERLLASGYTVEGPSWSPNGRVILFTHQYSPTVGAPLKSKLVSVDLTGTNRRILNTPTNASNAHWSAVSQK